MYVKGGSNLRTGEHTAIWTRHTRSACLILHAFGSVSRDYQVTWHHSSLIVGM